VHGIWNTICHAPQGSAIEIWPKPGSLINGSFGATVLTDYSIFPSLNNRRTRTRTRTRTTFTSPEKPKISKSLHKYGLIWKKKNWWNTRNNYKGLMYLSLAGPATKLVPFFIFIFIFLQSEWKVIDVIEHFGVSLFCSAREERCRLWTEVNIYLIS
jgi:hypothetical protein